MKIDIRQNDMRIIEQSNDLFLLKDIRTDNMMLLTLYDLQDIRDMVTKICPERVAEDMEIVALRIIVSE